MKEMGAFLYAKTPWLKPLGLSASSDGGDV